MPEWRTGNPEPSDGGGGGGGFDMESAVRSAYKRLLENPDQQKQVAAALAENYGVPPAALAPVFPAISDGDGQQPSDAGQQPAPAGGPAPADAAAPPATDPPEPATDGGEVDLAAHVTPDDLSGFLEEVRAVAGDDMTLGELQDFVENNPDMVETAIKMGL